MNRTVALAVLLAALAATAPVSADGDDGFQCGFRLGGADETPASHYRAHRDEALPIDPRGFAPGPRISALAPPPNPVEAKAAEQRRRLPPTITVARFGCSWK